MLPAGPHRLMRITVYGQSGRQPTPHKGMWCNGSTRDFGSLCRGSSPRIPTNRSDALLVFIDDIFTQSARLFIKAS